MDPAENPETHGIKRIISWGLPRSLSTVFEKCMSFVPDIQVINEPYNCAATFGPEGFAKTGHVNGVKEFGNFMNAVKQKVEANPDMYNNGWNDDDCTFEWVKKTLEKDYPGKKMVFCKDFIFNLKDRYEMIPRGFTHTFMIRNPTKLFLSNRKNTVAVLPPDDANKFNIAEVPSWKIYPKYGYGELLDLIGYLKEQGIIQSNPIVIDADDLQNHPASILRQYCQSVGIPYNDSLLTWEAGDACVSRNWYISKSYLAANPMIGFYDAAFASTNFQPAMDLATPLPDDVVKLAARAEPYYQELYNMRIKP